MLEMAAKVMSEGFGDLVDQLKQLEDFLPLLGGLDDREELEDEVRELEQLVGLAGEPKDEHSMRALAYLQTELAHKRARLDEF